MADERPRQPLMTALLSIAEAREEILGLTPRMSSERVDIADALDRVLAEDVNAADDVPRFACSAMDGYAIKAGPAGRTLTVVAESRAGVPALASVTAEQAIRVSTGAAVPTGASAVIRQEDVSGDGAQIETRSDTAVGANIREAGEDMLAGTTVLEAGTVLGAAELGAAVAAGLSQLTVARRPRVAVLCTGDELREPGEPLGPGEIHNSNGVMLAALACRCGARVDGPRRVPDERAVTEAALDAALRHADVVIISGGVSVGPHDHVKPALARLAVAERFWGVALQPGKPTWFGHRDEKLVFGLPGNPVSAVVTFTLFAARALSTLQGATPRHGPETKVALGASVRLNTTREQALRVRLEHDGERTVALPNGPQGSHIVTSLVGADALALIPKGEGELPAGAQVSLEPLPD